jgi:hypothetical protein
VKAEETTDSGSKRTRWDIQREVGGRAAYESAKGRLFSIGDTVVLPPLLPRGSLWTVIAVEPPETAGYEGTLVLISARPDSWPGTGVAESAE